MAKNREFNHHKNPLDSIMKRNKKAERAFKGKNIVSEGTKKTKSLEEDLTNSLLKEISKVNARLELMEDKLKNKKIIDDSDPAVVKILIGGMLFEGVMKRINED